MAFNQRKEKEIAMARMTLHSSTTTNQSVCVCVCGGWGGMVWWVYIKAKTQTGEA